MMCKNVNICKSVYTTNNNMTCNNCGKLGHLFHQCKIPITSYGVVLYRRNANVDGGIEFLMIRRKNSFGFIDFMRGKYNVNDREHLKIMFDEMSLEEKGMIMNKSFNMLWREMWGITDYIVNNNHHRTEENMSRKKFECLSNKRSNSFDSHAFTFKSSSSSSFTSESDTEPCTCCNECECIKNTFTKDNDLEIKINALQEYIETSSTSWIDTEWEFPKGRNDSFEKDLECAVREFEEETGIKKENIHVIENLLPFEEYFIGSNKKSYKYKYFLAEYKNNYINDYELTNFQPSEVSKMEWKTYNTCMNDIRPYYTCKKQIITKIYKLLHLYHMEHINVCFV